MTNNTYQHISNQSKYVAFDPTGSAFPSTVTTVQQALSLAGPSSQATINLAGIAKLASVDEVNAGKDNTKIVTPYTLNARLQWPDASTTTKGVVMLATDTEAKAGSNTTKSIVPSSLKVTLTDWFSRVPTTTVSGTIKISSTQAATAGVEDTTAMSPLKVKQAIAAATSSIPSYTSATESNAGIITLATVGQVSAGTLRDGYAISPYAFNKTTTSTSRYGTCKTATQSDVNTGTADDIVISAKGFKTFLASTTQIGTVKLTQTVGDTTQGAALAANANVISSTGGTVTGVLNVNGTLNVNGSPVVPKSYIDNSVPIGCVQMWAGPKTPSGGMWAICDGGAESKTDRPELFAAIGYTYGGSGDVFYRPDMRGLFVRGVGTSQSIINERGIDETGKLKLGEGVNGGSIGQVQKQQIKGHKHVTAWGASTNRTNLVFGATSLRRYVGTEKRSDMDNYNGFTNDGSEYESSEIRDSFGTMNPSELIGSDNRPWNMSLFYIIKVA